MRTFTDISRAGTQGFGLYHHDSDNGGWVDGAVVTPFGIVAVMSQKDFTRIDFVWQGIHYTKSMHYNGPPKTKRGLTVLGAKFARTTVAEIEDINKQKAKSCPPE